MRFFRLWISRPLMCRSSPAPWMSRPLQGCRRAFAPPTPRCCAAVADLAGLDLDVRPDLGAPTEPRAGAEVGVRPDCRVGSDDGAIRRRTTNNRVLADVGAGQRRVGADDGTSSYDGGALELGVGE